MKRFWVICTHNPQDDFTGCEPQELVRQYAVFNLKRAVARELKNGRHVVVRSFTKERRNGKKQRHKGKKRL